MQPWLIKFRRDVVTDYHWLGLKTTETYSLTVQEARSLKSRCWQSHAPSEGSREESTPCFSSTFWWLLAILWVLCLVAVALQSLPLPSLVLLPFGLYVSVSPNGPLLIRTSDIGFRDHLNPVWLHLNLIMSEKTLFPNKVTVTSSRWKLIGVGGTTLGMSLNLPMPQFPYQ